MKTKNFLLLLISLLTHETSIAQAASKKDSKPTESAYLAGGCFWGMEELIRKQPGVISTEVGYMGGKPGTGVYKLVSTGVTGHAETVKVVFDPQKTTYWDILLFFFKIHDPTTLNQQGNDIGTQYRSAIFAQDEKQKETAQQVVAQVERSKAWGKPLTTEVKIDKNFYTAEEYHQKYLAKNPGGYTCHKIRDLKF